jgi:hypothetical protein
MLMNMKKNGPAAGQIAARKNEGDERLQNDRAEDA